MPGMCSLFNKSQNIITIVSRKEDESSGISMPRDYHSLNDTYEKMVLSDNGKYMSPIYFLTFVLYNLSKDPGQRPLSDEVREHNQEDPDPRDGPQRKEAAPRRDGRGRVPAVEVLVPEQEVSDGRLVLIVVEGVIGDVALAGGEHLNTGRVARGVHVVEQDHVGEAVQVLEPVDQGSVDLDRAGTAGVARRLNRHGRRVPERAADESDRVVGDFHGSWDPA